MKTLWQYGIRRSRVVLYGAWFLTFGNLLADRDYERFLRPEFGSLLALGAFALLAFGGVEAGRPGQEAKPVAASVLRWLVLIAPLVYLPLTQGVALDAAAFDKRWTGLAGTAEQVRPLVGRAGLVVATGVRSVTLSDLLWDYARHDGKRVSVEGMVRRNREVAAEYGDNAFLLYRFVVSCCVADAIPAVVVIVGRAPPEWPDGTWLSVQGRVAIETSDGCDVVRMDVERAVACPQPKQPYLY